MVIGHVVGDAVCVEAQPGALPVGGDQASHQAIALLRNGVGLGPGHLEAGRLIVDVFAGVRVDGEQGRRPIAVQPLVELLQDVHRIPQVLQAAGHLPGDGSVDLDLGEPVGADRPAVMPQMPGHQTHPGGSGRGGGLGRQVGFRAEGDDPQAPDDPQAT
jgi:hypothetical protein